MIKVSVIMPAYNAAKYIADSIESVRAQTYTEWELIVVDDGSQDSTSDIAVEYAKKDERIKCFWQPNGKQGKARNLGLSNATGNLIAFLDADDLWLPDKLSRQINLINELNVDLVFSDSYLFQDFLYESSEKMNTPNGKIWGQAGIIRMLQGNVVPALTVLVKKDVIKDVGFFTEKLIIQNAEDYHLWLKLLMKGYTLYGMKDVLAAYRVHESASTYGNKLAIGQVIEALNDLSLLFPEHSSIIRSYIKKWFISYHFNTNNWERETYISLIRKNCDYLDKGRYSKFYTMLYKVFGMRVTRKILSKLINE